jgi:hypothetical protein
MPQDMETARIQELRAIAAEHGGILKAEDVVRAAENPESSLHSAFEWDDSEAAHQWRLCQARNLIRVTVQYVEPIDAAPMRVFVSLSPDRAVEGGGYRDTVQVLTTKALREQLLEDAVEDMNRFKEKYKKLKELSEVIQSMSRAELRILKNN